MVSHHRVPTQASSEQALAYLLPAQVCRIISDHFMNRVNRAICDDPYVLHGRTLIIPRVFNKSRLLAHLEGYAHQYSSISFVPGYSRLVSVVIHHCDA